ILMQELGRHVSDQTQILFGAAVDARLGDRLSVTIISSLSADEEEVLLQTPPAASGASAVSPVRERHDEAEAAESEIQSQQQTDGVQPLGETIPFEQPGSTEAEPVATSIPSEPSVVPARNGEPNPGMRTPEEKSPWKKEERSGEKSTSPA